MITKTDLEYFGVATQEELHYLLIDLEDRFFGEPIIDDIIQRMSRRQVRDFLDWLDLSYNYVAIDTDDLPSLRCYNIAMKKL